MNRLGDDQVKIIIAKVGALFAIGVLSFVCGVLPYYSIRAFRNRFPTSTVQRITTGFICFSGGSLLGVTFLHLLPEVREKISSLQSRHNVFHFPSSLPLSDIIAMSGFFGVYLLDELLHIFLEWYSCKMKRNKAKAREDEDNYSSEKICSQLPHDLSVFSLDKHENSKHQVAICRRSNYHATSVPNCACQTSKSIDGEPSGGKDFLPVGKELEILKSKKAKSESVLKTAPFKDWPPSTTSHLLPPVSGLLTIAALSFHDVFEGIAIGIEDNLNSILFLYLSIAAHKYAIAFCIGMDLVVAGSKLKTIVLSMMTFSVVSPIGVIIGMALIADKFSASKYEMESPTSVVMQGIAGGTLIYVVFFEVLQRERTDTHKKGIQNVVFVVCGFLVTLVFKLLTGHSH